MVLLLVGAGGFRAQQQPQQPEATQPATRPGAEGAAGAAGAQAVIVTSVEGKARARVSPDAPWEIVREGMRLPQGAEIQTGARSRVVCSVPPGREFIVDRLSTVTVLEADQRGNKATTDLLMEYGRADLRVQAAGLEHDAKIRTPGATASVRGTELSVYNQPPFAPELRTFTGLVDYRFAKRQMTVGKGGRSLGGRGAAETAFRQTVVDPSTANARTNADAALIAEQTNVGAVSNYNPDIQLTEVHGGTPATSGQLMSNLPGKLTFAIRWSGNADVDILVAFDRRITLGGIIQPEQILYPNFGMETSPTGGRIPYNHRGGRNGGQELCFWPDSFPTAVYGFSAINNSESTPADVKFNVFMNGQKISMYAFDQDFNLIRSKGLLRTIPPLGTDSAIVGVPPDPFFESLPPPLVIDSPDQTIDGTEPPGSTAPPPPPPGKTVLASAAPSDAAQVATSRANPARGRAAEAARKAAARDQAKAAKLSRQAAARDARAAKAPKAAAPRPQVNVNVRKR